MAKSRYKKKAPSRGGKREGAGRKPFIPSIVIPLADRQAAADYARQHVSECIDGLMDIARNSESDAARKSAYDSVLNRALGAVPQGLELTGKDGKDIDTGAGFREFVTALDKIANIKGSKDK